MYLLEITLIICYSIILKGQFETNSTLNETTIEILNETLVDLDCNETETKPLGVPDFDNSTFQCLLEVIKGQFSPSPRPQLLNFITNGDLSDEAISIQDALFAHLSQLNNWVVKVSARETLWFESSDVCFRNNETEGDEICKRQFQPEVKPSYNVFITDSEENFNSSLSFLVESKDFTSKGKFLIYYSQYQEDYQKVAKDILQALWLHRVYKSVVVVPVGPSRLFYALDVFASGEKCMNEPRFVLVETCQDGGTLKKWDLFKHSTPQDFLNCSIDVVSMIYPPYVIDEESGFEIQLIREIGKKLNFTLNFAIENVTSDWNEGSGGNWTGKLGHVKNFSAVGLGNFQAMEAMGSDFSFSVDYFHDSMIWVVPRADRLPRWLVVFVLFTPDVWLAWFLIFLGGGISICFFARTKGEIPDLKSLGCSLILALQGFIGNSSRTEPRTRNPRFVFLGLLIFCIVATSAYTSTLITVLTNDVYEHQVDSEEEILTSGMQIGGLKVSKGIFNGSDSDRKIFDRYQTASDKDDVTDYWLNRVKKQRNLATVMGQFYVKFLISSNDSSACFPNARPAVYPVKEIIFTYSVKMVFAKNYILLKSFDNLISKFLMAGIIDKWAGEFLERLKKMEGLAQRNKRVEKLTLNHVEGAFAILGMGLGLASIVFGLETAAFWFLRRRRLRIFTRNLLTWKLKKANALKGTRKNWKEAVRKIQEDKSRGKFKLSRLKFGNLAQSLVNVSKKRK